MLAANISPATKSEATGSKRFHPVARMRMPARAVPTKAARSVAMCR